MNRILLLPLALALGILTACGGGGGDDESEQAGPDRGTQPPSCTANPKQCG